MNLLGICENGQQAADFVKTHPVDIVLTDMLMPYMEAFQLYKTPGLVKGKILLMNED